MILEVVSAVDTKKNFNLTINKNQTKAKFLLTWIPLRQSVRSQNHQASTRPRVSHYAR